MHHKVALAMIELIFETLTIQIDLGKENRA